MENNSHQLCKKVPPPTKRIHEYSDNVTRLLRMASSLTPEESLGLCCGLVKRSGMSAENLNTLKNFIVPQVKARKASGQQSTVNPSAPPTSQKEEVETAPSKSLPHHQVSLIVRGDLVQEGAPLALDVEKLVQHTSATDRKTRNVGGDFALVDLQGRVVMWCYIYRENVCVYNTKQTGLDKRKVEGGIDEFTFHEILRRILKRNILIGAALKDNLMDLGFNLSNLPGNSTAYDIQDFFLDEQGQRVSLAILAEHFTGQPFQTGTHSSLADARMTMLAYKRMLKFKADNKPFFCAEFNQFRAEMRAKKQKEKEAEKKDGKKREKKWDTCTCFSKRSNFNLYETWKDPTKLPGI